MQPGDTQHGTSNNTERSTQPAPVSARARATRARIARAAMLDDQVARAAAAFEKLHQVDRVFLLGISEDLLAMQEAESACIRSENARLYGPLHAVGAVAPRRAQV